MRIYLKYNYSSAEFCNGMSQTLSTVLCKPFTKCFQRMICKDMFPILNFLNKLFPLSTSVVPSEVVDF